MSSEKNETQPDTTQDNMDVLLPCLLSHESIDEEIDDTLHLQNTPQTQAKMLFPVNPIAASLSKTVEKDLVNSTRDMTVSEDSHSDMSEEEVSDSRNNVTKNLYRPTYNQMKEKNVISKGVPLYNYEFYTNKRRSQPDRKLLSEMHSEWSQKYSILEAKHGYIQWLFPLLEKSMYNCDSYSLTDEEVAVMRTDRTVQDNLVKSLRMMLDFWGMRLVESAPAPAPIRSQAHIDSSSDSDNNAAKSSDTASDGNNTTHDSANTDNDVGSTTTTVTAALVSTPFPPQYKITRSKDYDQRYGDWMGGHNNLRMSRCIRCLFTLGKEDLAVALMEHFFMEIYTKEGSAQARKICDAFERFWIMIFEEGSKEYQEYAQGLKQRIRNAISMRTNIKAASRTTSGSDHRDVKSVSASSNLKSSSINLKTNVRPKNNILSFFSSLNNSASSSPNQNDVNPTSTNASKPSSSLSSPLQTQPSSPSTRVTVKPEYVNTTTATEDIISMSSQSAEQEQPMKKRKISK